MKDTVKNLIILIIILVNKLFLQVKMEASKYLGGNFHIFGGGSSLKGEILKGTSNTSEELHKIIGNTKGTS